MEWMIWTGAVVTLCGLALLVWCILRIARDRAASLPDDELRARLQKAVIWNFAALLLSALGLIMVIVGIAFG